MILAVYYRLALSVRRMGAVQLWASGRCREGLVIFFKQDCICLSNGNPDTLYNGRAIDALINILYNIKSTYDKVIWILAVDHIWSYICLIILCTLFFLLRVAIFRLLPVFRENWFWNAICGYALYLIYPSFNNLK